MDEKLVNFEANFSVLERYGEDITANEFITNPAIGRDEQIKELILILLTPEKSAILIGKPGIGKTAIVEGLAYRMQKSDVPDALKGYTIINIKTASLLGTMPSGESKVQIMIDELKTREKVILFVDEIHMLIGATDSSSLDFANIFKEGLGRGSIKVIGATTTEEYERYILRDKAFTRRFQKVEVPEPSRDETIKIMMGTLPKFEKQTGRKMKYTPFIQERIMSFLVDITSEYKRVFALGSRYPDVCLTLLKQAFSYTVYDNREYMDIFDIRKAIENSKNIYPDVIRKELPNFDKNFNDIILEERGEKPIEEWRRETGPTRYEQETGKSIISNMNSLSNNPNNIVEPNLVMLESMPSMVDKNSLRERQPVKTILSEKTLKKFAKIGPTAISRGIKEKFNQKSDSKQIDDLLLSSPIGTISHDKRPEFEIPIKTVTAEELQPGGTNNLLLGRPIGSTLDDGEERKTEIIPYKSDSIIDKELDPTKNGLILDMANKNENVINNSIFVDNNRSRLQENKNINSKKPVENAGSSKENFAVNSGSERMNKDFLFGAPMYSSDAKEEKEDNVTTDMSGQVMTSNSNPVISNPNNEKLNNNIFMEKTKIESENNNTKSNIHNKKEEFLFGAPMYDYKSESAENSSASKTTDIFGQLIVPDSTMRIKDGKIVDDFSKLARSPIESKTIIGEVSNNNSSLNVFDNLNANGFSPTSESANIGENNSPIASKKWKFIGEFDEKTINENNSFNELKVPSYNDNNKQESKIINEMTTSNNFINFNDLNAGKIPSREVNKFISLSNVNQANSASNNQIKDYSNNRIDERRNVSIDLKLEDKVETDNYFDDFFED